MFNIFPCIFKDYKKKIHEKLIFKSKNLETKQNIFGLETKHHGLRKLNFRSNHSQL